MYSAVKLRFWNIGALHRVADILHKCGKDMADRYDLHHWDNSYLKNCLIVLLCAARNDLYLVFDHKVPVATFQTRKMGQSLLFQKLATDPAFSGKGIGTFCLNIISRMAQESGCIDIVCEVFDHSRHAIEFYEHNGFSVCGTAKTLKYKELKMIKKL